MGRSPLRPPSLLRFDRNDGASCQQCAAATATPIQGNGAVAGRRRSASSTCQQPPKGIDRTVAEASAPPPEVPHRLRPRLRAFGSRYRGSQYRPLKVRPAAIHMAPRLGCFRWNVGAVPPVG